MGESGAVPAVESEAPSAKGRWGPLLENEEFSKRPQQSIEPNTRSFGAWVGPCEVA